MTETKIFFNVEAAAKKADGILKAKDAARKERLAASRANRHLNPAQ